LRAATCDPASANPREARSLTQDSHSPGRAGSGRGLS
jgi:hypothetical protein